MTGAEGAVAPKRVKVEYSSPPAPQSGGQDPFTFDQEGAAQRPAVAKPRKFFKNRGAEAAKDAEIRLQASVYMNNEQCSEYVSRNSEIQYPARKQQHTSASVAKNKSSKFFTSRHKYTESSTSRVSSVAELSMATTYSSHSAAAPLPLLSDTSLQAEVKPPIRLRIFKDKGTSHLVSETQVLTSDESVDLTPHTTPQNPPQFQESVVENTYYSSQTISSDKNSESESTEHSIEINEEINQTENVNSINIPCEYQSETPNGNNMEEQEDEEEMNEEEEDKEKLLKAAELLSDTFVDFSSATEKLLLDPKQILPTTSKAVLANDWFSENEDDSSNDDTPEPEHPQTTELDTSQQLSSQEEVAIHSAPCSQQTITSEEGSQPMEEQSLSQPELGSKRQSPEKKGSIFKSRRLLTGGPKKRLALYKHKWSDDKEEKEKAANAAGTSQASAASAAPSNVFDEEFNESEVLTRIKRPVDSTNMEPHEEEETVTGVLCSRAARKVSFSHISHHFLTF